MTSIEIEILTKLYSRYALAHFQDSHIFSPSDTQLREDVSPFSIESIINLLSQSITEYIFYRQVFFFQIRVESNNLKEKKIVKTIIKVCANLFTKQEDTNTE